MINDRHVRILTIALAAQAALIYGTSRGENTPPIAPLETFARGFGGWYQTAEGHVDEETQSVLKADDTLVRSYGSAKFPAQASLFVAYFKTQRTGKAPHSPKNCLPGSGWETSQADYLAIDVPGVATPVEVNRYIVRKGDNRSLVLYWYQTERRVIASEYRAKVWTVADAIRYNRTDTALVRVVVPIAGDESGAERAAVDFVQALFPALRRHLPS
jgi:EpsI family protein